MSFIDDKTHFAMVYLMKRKSEYFEKFREYEALVTAWWTALVEKKGIQVENRRFYAPAKRRG